MEDVVWISTVDVRQAYHLIRIMTDSNGLDHLFSLLNTYYKHDAIFVQTSLHLWFLLWICCLQHALRAHYQTAVWLSPSVAPLLNPLEFGWKCEGSALIPDLGVQHIAPPELEKIISCSCSSAEPCSKRCSCKQSKLSCTAFCACSASLECANEHTIQFSEPGQEDSNDASDNSDIDATYE